MADTAVPKMPDLVTIPPQAIREWTQIPSIESLDIEISRSTIDHLFFALRRMAESQSKFHACLIRYSLGDLAAANALLAESQVSLAESDNQIAQFMTDIMLSATRGP